MTSTTSSLSAPSSRRGERDLSPALLTKHSKLWRKIEITDIPTGEHGRYEYTPKDSVTTSQKGAAAMPVILKTRCSKDEVVKQPEYWALLGRMVLKSKAARCFGCASAAVYSLVADPECDDLVIAVMGNSAFDHHYVAVGETLGEIEAKRGHAIDIWDGNLNKASYVTPLAHFRYAEGKPSVFCVLLPSQRAALRAWVTDA